VAQGDIRQVRLERVAVERVVLWSVGVHVDEQHVETVSDEVALEVGQGVVPKTASLQLEICTKNIKLSICINTFISFMYMYAYML
jgi:hypothetical protein